MMTERGYLKALMTGECTLADNQESCIDLRVDIHWYLLGIYEKSFAETEQNFITSVPPISKIVLELTLETVRSQQS